MAEASVMKRILFAAQFVILMTAEATAQDQACFCLQHEMSKSVRIGCEEFKPSNAPPVATQVECRANVESVERAPVTNLQNFTRLSAGAGQCNPCNPPPVGKLPDTIRQP
jgi:hypothetical protein